jgi:hypothetical protein
MEASASFVLVMLPLITVLAMRVLSAFTLVMQVPFLLSVL